MNTAAPLYGLLLVGGKSSRMGTDKAQLIYQQDTPEWKRLHSLLEQCCEQTFLCHREDQNFNQQAIIDPADGPLRAIHTAQLAHPHAAWLVIACDLPLLDLNTLENLISKRDITNIASCYSSAIDQLPEPLCCIYEPSSSPAIQQALDSQKFCPRNILTSAHTIALPQQNTLINANTKADTLEIQAILNQTQTKKSLHIQYFAQLKDIAKKDEETIETFSETPSGLYEELRATYKFPYKQKQLMLAINDEFAEWDYVLTENDNVVFIPPVAGG